MTLQVEFSESVSVLQVEFCESEPTLQVTFDPEQSFEVFFGELFEVDTENIPAYSGPYTLKSSLDTQRMETLGTKMKEDVQIEGLPIYVVSNNSGGNTVIIGG